MSIKYLGETGTTKLVSLLKALIPSAVEEYLQKSGAGNETYFEIDTDGGLMPTDSTILSANFETDDDGDIMPANSE